MTVQWLPHVSVERVGDEILVLDSSSGIVHRFPREFSEIVDAVSTSQPVSSHHPHVALLADANLITPIRGVSLSRRRVVVGGAGVMAGGLIASASLPATALASSPRSTPPDESSETFTLPNDLFMWFGGFLTVFPSRGLAPFGIFELGDTWTIGVRRTETTFTSETQVTEESGELVLIFSFDIPAPEDAVPIEGQLFGPNGQRSNPFLVSPARFE